MLKITGIAKEVKRHRVVPPKDKVHRASTADGLIKGTKGMLLNRSILLPRGMSGFFYRHKKDKGVKIFYSFHYDRICKKRVVKKQFKKHYKLYKLGIASKPYEVVEVALDFIAYDKRDGKRRVKTRAYGIVQQYVDYPKKAWMNYVAGKAYDFKCLDNKKHPEHSPKGYLKFCKMMKKKLIENKIGVCGNFPYKEQEPPKLGDCVYSVKNRRWYLVDVGD